MMIVHDDRNLVGSVETKQLNRAVLVHMAAVDNPPLDIRVVVVL